MFQGSRSRIVKLPFIPKDREREKNNIIDVMCYNLSETCDYHLVLKQITSKEESLMIIAMFL